MNRIDELFKLKELLDSGIINKDDFEKKRAELLSDINTGNQDLDSIKKEEIISGENEKVCPSCKCIIDKESGICNFCDYDFINNRFSDKIEPTIKSNNNFKKYIPVFFLIIISIFLGTWFFTENNSNKSRKLDLENNKTELQNKFSIKKSSSKNHNDNVSELPSAISESQNDLNNKSINQNIRNDFKTEKKLFFIGTNKKDIAYEIILKNDTIVIDVKYRLLPGEKSLWGDPDSDGYYSRFTNILLLKKGAIFDDATNKIYNDYRFINDRFYVKNYETKKYEEYIIKPSKSNCKIKDILEH
jgi:hypothetical protein